MVNIPAPWILESRAPMLSPHEFETGRWDDVRLYGRFVCCWDDEFFLAAKMTMPNRSAKNTRDLGWMVPRFPCFQWNRKVPKNFRHPWFAKEKTEVGRTARTDWIGCVFVGTCFKS